MAFVDPRIADTVAHMPGVKAAVRAERDKMAAVADGLFASHDHPGGHEIVKENGRTDALFSLDGPAPLSVEFGHWTPGHKRHVEGLHILGRTIAAATL